MKLWYPITQWCKQIQCNENKQALCEAWNLRFNSPLVSSHWAQDSPSLGFIIINCKITLIIMRLLYRPSGQKRWCLEIPDHLLFNNLKEKKPQFRTRYTRLYQFISSYSTRSYWSRLWIACFLTNTSGSSTTHWSLWSQMWIGSCLDHPSGSFANMSPYIRGKWLIRHVSTNKSFLYQIFSDCSNMSGTLLSAMWDTNKHETWLNWVYLGI